MDAFSVCFIPGLSIQTKAWCVSHRGHVWCTDVFVALAFVQLFVAACELIMIIQLRVLGALLLSTLNPYQCNSAQCKQHAFPSFPFSSHHCVF